MTIDPDGMMMTININPLDMYFLLLERILASVYTKIAICISSNDVLPKRSLVICIILYNVL